MSTIRYFQPYRSQRSRVGPPANKPSNNKQSGSRGKRFFGNPASTAENLFYFGFLAESLARKAGRWWTPVLIGFMYILHEMSNPEYWYDNLPFGLVFVGIALTTVIYLWRRNIVVVWLGDGLIRFITGLT